MPLAPLTFRALLSVPFTAICKAPVEVRLPFTVRVPIGLVFPIKVRASLFKPGANVPLLVRLPLIVPVPVRVAPLATVTGLFKLPVRAKLPTLTLVAPV